MGVVLQAVSYGLVKALHLQAPTAVALGLGLTIAFYLLRHRHVSRGPRKERHFFDKEFLDWENPDYSAYVSPRRTPQQRWPHPPRTLRR